MFVLCKHLVYLSRMTNLQPAIDFFTSQKALADALGVNPMTVTQWKRRGLPPKRAKEIAALTNNAVKASVLLPGFFDEITNGDASKQESGLDICPPSTDSKCIPQDGDLNQPKQAKLPLRHPGRRRSDDRRGVNN